MPVPESATGADAVASRSVDDASSVDGAVSAPLADDPTTMPVVSSDRVFEGKVWDLRRDVVRYGDGEITREYVDHTGAVAILALDEEDRVLLIKQYRHPIASRDWELPAGLLDVDGESPLVSAQRELAEEADIEATDWRLLCEFFTSPGGSNETIRVFLARGLTATDPFDRFAEEADLEVRWAPLADVVDAVLQRSVSNSILGYAALAAAASKARGWSTLGDPEEPWDRHPKLRSRASAGSPASSGAAPSGSSEPASAGSSGAVESSGS